MGLSIMGAKLSDLEFVGYKELLSIIDSVDIILSLDGGINKNVGNKINEIKNILNNVLNDKITEEKDLEKAITCNNISYILEKLNKVKKITEKVKNNKDLDRSDDLLTTIVYSKLVIIDECINKINEIKKEYINKKNEIKYEHIGNLEDNKNNIIFSDLINEKLKHGQAKELASLISSADELEEFYKKKYGTIYRYGNNVDLCKIILNKFNAFSSEVEWDKKNKKRLSDLGRYLCSHKEAYDTYKKILNYLEENGI